MSCLKILVALFQQADYDPILFRAWLRRHPTPEEWNQFAERASVHWTPKARLLTELTVFFSMGISRRMPSALRFSRFILRPFERIAIRRIAARGRRKLETFQFREVIAITGSFGKTTTKEAIAHVLGAKFRVHKTPENTNTILGIARWILSKPDFHSGDILIVEMGAYRKGDIAEICRMARPTIGVLTGLNEAHLERFGSLENMFWTKGELLDALSVNSEMTSPNDEGRMLFWNHSSSLLKAFLEKRVARWRDIRFMPFDGNATNAVAAVGAHFGLSDAEIAAHLRTFQPMERRFAQTLALGNRLIIDDSYNITLDGARRAVAALRKIPRRKIGVFAGIPEAGHATERVNKELGELIARVFDTLLLRHTPYEKFIRSGLQASGFPQEHLLAYTESSEVQPLLARIVKDGDCVYFSAYDLPPIYL